MRWLDLPEIEGCGLLDFDRHTDDRGYFEECFNRDKIARLGIPLPWQWAQDNVSYSKPGILRGFHVQKDNPQGKLITCVTGKVLDVCLDVRKRSPTYGKVMRVILSSDNPQAFYLPPGTAHAFLSLENSILHYKCTTPYDQASDGGVNTYSPEFDMLWPDGSFLRSSKDRMLPMFIDYLKGMI